MAKKKSYNQKMKADDGKDRIAFVPTDGIRAVAKVREYGVNKYHNIDGWKTVERERYDDALGRHYLAYLDDPRGVDEESGLPHIWHLACNALFLCYFYKKGEKKDGRTKKA